MSVVPNNLAAVDICMPVYQAEAFVHESIESVLSQDFTDFRLLISVDHGNDDSLGVCRKFIGDKRVQVFDQRKRLGFVGNSNFLTHQARAPYMKFAPHDDLMTKAELDTLFEFMEQAPECSIAIPTVLGFGEDSAIFDQFEVRGPALRRLLDIIMNQRSVAAYHGLVRIRQDPDRRPALPDGYARDFEADVYWMAVAATQGELRRVKQATEQKRYSRNMASTVWRPNNFRESSRLLLQHTARLTELAFSICHNDQHRRLVMMAAVTRLLGQGLNYGLAKSGQDLPLYRWWAIPALFRELNGEAAQFADSLNRARLTKDIRSDHGIVGASRLARQLENSLQAGDTELAETLYHQALEMDPQAGWADPFHQQLTQLQSQ